MYNKKLYCRISILIFLISLLTVVCTSAVYATETSAVAFDVNQTNIEKSTGEIIKYGPRDTSPYKNGSMKDLHSAQHAALYIKNTMIRYNLSTKFEEVSNGAYNVVGIKPGSKLKDQIIIIIAHYDTAPKSLGADDCALSVAVTLEVARMLQNYSLDRTVYFMAVPEHGVKGAAEWVSEHSDLRENITCVINVDQVGYGDSLRIIYIPQHSWLKNSIRESAINMGIPLYEDESNLRAYSNHCPFWRNNIPAIMLLEKTFTPYHHTPEDTIEHLNFSLSTDAARIVVESVYNLANPKDTTPLAVVIGRPHDGTIVGTNLLKLIYNASECNCTVEVFLDGQNLGYIESGHMFILTKGSHSLRVKATDEWGNSGSDAVTFTIDPVTWPKTTSKILPTWLVVVVVIITLFVVAMVVIIRLKK